MQALSRQVSPLLGLLLLCAFFSGPTGWAQPSRRDSLRQVLATTVRDTQYVLALCDYSYSFDNNSYDSLYRYASQAAKLAQELNYARGIGYAFWLKGMASYYLDQVDSTKIFLEQALPAATAAGDNLMLGRIYNSMANAARYRGHLTLALEYYFRSLHIKEKIGDEYGAAISLNNIANVYSEQQDFRRAASYYRRSLDLRRKINREGTAIMLLSTMGENYMFMGNYDSAYYFLKRSLNFAHQMVDPWGYVHAHHGLTNYFMQQKRYDSALYYTHLGLITSRKAGSLDRETLFLLKQSEILNLQNKFSHSLQIADSALILAKKLKRLEYEMMAEQRRSTAFAGLGNFSSAFQSHQRFKQLNDSLLANSYQEGLRVRELEYQLEREKLEAEGQRLTYEEKSKVNQALMWLFIAIATGVGALALLYYRHARMRQKANHRLTEQQRIIEEKNDRLIRQQQEIESVNTRLEAEVQRRTGELHETVKKLTEQNTGLEQFSYIISHNLRAPLARITGITYLLKIKQNSPDELTELISLLEKSSVGLDEVVRDLSQIITMHKTVDFVREIIALPDLINNVLKMEAAELEKVNMQVRVEVIGVNGEPEARVGTIRPFLHSILLNLVTNAIKYRSRTRNPELIISANLRPGFCDMEVRDNGIGIDLNEHNARKIFGLYNRFHPNIEGKGFGLYLVKTQLELMGGTIEVVSEVDKGTTFRFSFVNHEVQE